MGRGGTSSVTGSRSASPYTDEDDAYTTRSAPASRAAIRTLSVPVALASCDARGAATDRATDGMAASWNTRATPSVARPTVARCRTSPSMTSTSPSTSDRFSSTRTPNPRERSSRTRFEPMNPAPPVTRQSSLTERSSGPGAGRSRALQELGQGLVALAARLGPVRRHQVLQQGPDPPRLALRRRRGEQLDPPVQRVRVGFGAQPRHEDLVGAGGQRALLGQEDLLLQLLPRPDARELDGHVDVGLEAG